MIICEESHYQEEKIGMGLFLKKPNSRHRSAVGTIHDHSPIRQKRVNKQSFAPSILVDPKKGS